MKSKINMTIETWCPTNIQGKYKKVAIIKNENVWKLYIDGEEMCNISKIMETILSRRMTANETKSKLYPEPRHPEIRPIGAQKLTIQKEEKEYCNLKEVIFVRHIEAHLDIESKVICKICNKTIDEIYEAECDRRNKK